MGPESISITKFDTLLFDSGHKLEYAKHIAVVGDGYGGHSRGFGPESVSSYAVS